MKNKRGIESSFAWIFTIIAGAVIIFLAIFISMKFSNLFNFEQGSSTGKKIGILLTPFETNLEKDKQNLIRVDKEIEIFNDCNYNGDFGEQIIGVKIMDNIGDINEYGAESKFKNRYLFSDEFTNGTDFYLLSKSFDFPYKIGDLIILWGNNQKYCFIDPFEDILKDIGKSKLKNIRNVTSDSCYDDEIKVCFSRRNSCDIIVYTNENIVKHVLKDNEEVYYVDMENNGLMYAAIFSSPKIYDCQIKRLMKRSEILSEIYTKKALFLESKGCGAPRLNYFFRNYKSEINSIYNMDISDIRSLENFANSLGEENELLNCQLF